MLTPNLAKKKLTIKYMVQEAPPNFISFLDIGIKNIMDANKYHLFNHAEIKL